MLEELLPPSSEVLSKFGHNRIGHRNLVVRQPDMCGKHLSQNKAVETRIGDGGLTHHGALAERTRK